MNKQSLITSWYKPRIALQYLEQSPKSQFLTFFVLLFSYFFQLCLFCFYPEQEMIDRFFSLEGLIVAILTLIVMGLNLMSLIYAASMGFWMVAQCLNGKASLSQTRAAVLWTAIWSIPTGFLVFIFRFATLFTIEIISCLAILFSIMYVFIVLIKSLSDVNRFGFWRTMFSIIGGFFVVAIVVYLAIKFYRALGLFQHKP